MSGMAEHFWQALVALQWLLVVMMIPVVSLLIHGKANRLVAASKWYFYHSRKREIKEGMGQFVVKKALARRLDTSGETNANAAIPEQQKDGKCNNRPKARKAPRNGSSARGRGARAKAKRS